MGAAAVPLTVAAGGLQAFGAINASREQARAASIEQQNLNIQRSEAAIAAQQEEAARREDLNSTLQTIAAITAGRNVAPSSPSLRAAIAGQVATAEGDIATARYNALSQQDAFRRASREAGRRRSSALTSGYLNALGAGIQTGMNVNNIRSGGR